MLTNINDLWIRFITSNVIQQTEEDYIVQLNTKHHRDLAPLPGFMT